MIGEYAGQRLKLNGGIGVEWILLINIELAVQNLTHAL